MEILSIAAVGIITAFVVLLLKDSRGDIALLIGITGGIIILLSVIEYFSTLFSFMDNLIQSAGIDSSVIRVLLKIIGVGYIADFSAGLVEESGSKALSEKIALAGKLIILVLTIPIIQLLFEIITGLLQ